MNRARPLHGVNAPAVELVRGRQAIFDGLENLPIVFQRDGEVLTGTLTLAVGADLRKLSRDQAERDIRKMMKHALMSGAAK